MISGLAHWLLPYPSPEKRLSNFDLLPADLPHVATNPIRTWKKLIGLSNIDWELLIIN